MVLCNCIPLLIDRYVWANKFPLSGMSHLICIADDCLAANCDEGAKAAAEAAIMAPRARENFIFSVLFKKMWHAMVQRMGYELELIKRTAPFSSTMRPIESNESTHS